MENEINYQPEENLNKVEQTTEITNESEEINSQKMKLLMKQRK
jgi:hypothetical protein